MKRYCKNFYFDRAAIEAGYEDWLKAEAGHKNAHRIPEQHGSVEALLDELAAEADAGSYSFAPIERYTRNEGGKRRLIGIVSVKQQIVEHAIAVALEPLFRAKIGYWQVASVEGKGAFFGAEKVQELMQTSRYFGHGDVRKCYQSVNLRALMRKLEKLIASTSLLAAIRAVLAMYENGLEIGSYLSLRLAQLVLSCGYHAAEQTGRRRRGKWVAALTGQVWYADDVYIFSSSKKGLRRAMRAVLDALAVFELLLKPWKLCRCDSEPCDFAGIVCTRGKRTIRSRIFLRIRRSFRKLARAPTPKRARRAVSYFGWLKHTDSRLFRASNGIDGLFAMARAIVSRQDRRLA